MKPQRNSHDEAVSITTLVSRHRNPLARFCFEQAPNGRAELSFTGAAEEGQQFFVSTEKTCRDPPAAIDYAREWPGRPEEGFSRLLWCAHQSRQAPAFLPKDRPVMAKMPAPGATGGRTTTAGKSLLREK